MGNFLLCIFALLSLLSHVNSHALPVLPVVAGSDCHIDHVILDDFGDETSCLFVGGTLKLVCVCAHTNFEPFHTKTVFQGYRKVLGSNALTSHYYTTTDGVVTIPITDKLRDTQFWCQNSQHYLVIPNEPMCRTGDEICYNDHCQSSQPVCLDSRNDKKVFKQVCVKGQSGNRISADLCRHLQDGSNGVAFMEVAQPKVCPELPSKSGGFITAKGNLIQVGTVRTVLDREWFSQHKILCHSAVTPHCFLVKYGGSLAKVPVCGVCSGPGSVVTAIVDHTTFRGPPFHRETAPYCRQGKLVCGDGKNFRYFIYVLLQGTKWYIPDDSNLQNVPVCDWPSTVALPKIGPGSSEE